MAFVGEQPWWIGTSEDVGQGRDLGENPVTAKEMFEAAGLDWRVQLGSMRAEITVEGKRVTTTVPNLKAVVREDTRAVLGVATGRYEPVQNITSMDFFDVVVGEGKAYYHTAGAIGAGEQVWILARLPQEIVINGSDVVESYVLLVNSHQPGFAFRTHFTPIRVVCQNTLNIAVRQGEGKGYRLTHFTGINKKLSPDDARKALGLAHDHLAVFGQQATELGQQGMKEEEIEGFLQRVFPIEPKYLLEAPKPHTLLLLKEPDPKDYVETAGWGEAIFKKRELVRNLFVNGKGNDHPDVAGTRWAAFNAVAEFTDYLDGWDKTRTKSLLFGNGQVTKQLAWDILTTAK